MTSPHIPVLIDPILTHIAPVSGLWVDGTMGAGGYTRALLDGGADQVVGIDRDPLALSMAADWGQAYGARLRPVQATFSTMDDAVERADGVVLDLGVSSMQLDHADRGFSFQKDGPLDMRMGGDGPTAADIVNTAPQTALEDILYHYGEERAARRIAKQIVQMRSTDPFETTLQLAGAIERCLPRPKPGQSHPATRSFQALRIAVNQEYDQLSAGLSAAERILTQGGILAVVTFHSIEDRMVKRFFQRRSGKQQGSRYAPATTGPAASFEPITRKAIGPSDDEIAANPRARSAKLRMARRTAAPAFDRDDKGLSMPQLPQRGHR